MVNQTFKELEIIVVNDGSPDNSQEIIDKYQLKYPKKIRAYKKKNGGLSDARNYGIKKAAGEYITFLDADDYVEKDTYEKMYKKAKENNFDVVVCNLLYEFPDKVIKSNSNITKDLFNEDELKKFMLDIYPVAWNKIYKKELFDLGIQFKNGVWFEDVEFLYKLYPYIKNIGVVEDYLIHYVQRDGAITKTFDERLYCYIENWNGIIDYYKKNNFLAKYEKEIEFCYVRYLYATFIKQALNYTSKAEYDKAVKCAISEVKKHFPNYRKNRLFYKQLKGIYFVVFNSLIANIMWAIKRK